MLQEKYSKEYLISIKNNLKEVWGEMVISEALVLTVMDQEELLDLDYIISLILCSNFNNGDDYNNFYNKNITTDKHHLFRYIQYLFELFKKYYSFENPQSKLLTQVDIINTLVKIIEDKKISYENLYFYFNAFEGENGLIENLKDNWSYHLKKYELNSRKELFVSKKNQKNFLTHFDLKIGKDFLNQSNVEKSFDYNNNLFPNDNFDLVLDIDLEKPKKDESVFEDDVVITFEKIPFDILEFFRNKKEEDLTKSQWIVLKNLLKLNIKINILNEYGLPADLFFFSFPDFKSITFRIDKKELEEEFVTNILSFIISRNKKIFKNSGDFFKQYLIIMKILNAIFNNFSMKIDKKNYYINNINISKNEELSQCFLIKKVFFENNLEKLFKFITNTNNLSIDEMDDLYALAKNNLWISKNENEKMFFSNIIKNNFNDYNLKKLLIKEDLYQFYLHKRINYDYAVRDLVVNSYIKRVIDKENLEIPSYLIKSNPIYKMDNEKIKTFLHNVWLPLFIENGMNFSESMVKGFDVIAVNSNFHLKSLVFREVFDDNIEQISFFINDDIYIDDDVLNIYLGWFEENKNKISNLDLELILLKKNIFYNLAIKELFNRNKKNIFVEKVYELSKDQQKNIMINTFDNSDIKYIVKNLSVVNPLIFKENISNLKIDELKQFIQKIQFNNELLKTISVFEKKESEKLESIDNKDLDFKLNIFKKKRVIKKFKIVKSDLIDYKLKFEDYKNNKVVNEISKLFNKKSIYDELDLSIIHCIYINKLNVEKFLNIKEELYYYNLLLYSIFSKTFKNQNDVNDVKSTFELKNSYYLKNYDDYIPNKYRENELFKKIYETKANIVKNNMKIKDIIDLFIFAKEQGFVDKHAKLICDLNIPDIKEMLCWDLFDKRFNEIDFHNSNYFNENNNIIIGEKKEIKSDEEEIKNGLIKIIINNNEIDLKIFDIVKNLNPKYVIADNIDKKLKAEDMLILIENIPLSVKNIVLKNNIDEFYNIIKLKPKNINIWDYLKEISLNKIVKPSVIGNIYYYHAKLYREVLDKRTKSVFEDLIYIKNNTKLNSKSVFKKFDFAEFNVEGAYRELDLMEKIDSKEELNSRKKI